MKDFLSYEEGDNGKDEIGQAIASAAKGEGELLKEIYARAAEGKRAGTLTNEQIDDFCARFAPMLDAGKRKKLYRLAEQLKRM